MMATTGKTLIDPELERIARECRMVATTMRSQHNAEITAALINYRAAQMIANTLGELIEAVRTIAQNQR